MSYRFELIVFYQGSCLTVLTSLCFTRVEVMIKIQAELRRGQGGQAVALLRTAR